MQLKINKQMLRGFLVVSVFVLGSFALSGCIGQDEEPPMTTTVTKPGTTVTQPGTTVTTVKPTLTLIAGWAGEEMEAFLPVLDVFTAKTGIEVNYVISRSEDSTPVLPAQFAAGVTPADVLFVWDWWISENTEHFVDVSDMVNPSDFGPGFIDKVTVEGKIYGSSYTGKGKPGFWYRLSFFEEHGLQIPTTWDQFMSLLDNIQAISGIDTAIASGDGVGWPLSDITEHFILTYGGVDLFNDLIDGSVSWTSPEVQDVFENYLVPVLEAGHFSEPKQWDLIINDWWDGKHGLYFMGSWLTGMVEDSSDLGVMALPGAQAFIFNADFFGIPKYTKHLAEAKLLMEFLSSVEGQTKQVEQGGHIATHLDVSLDSYPALDRQMAVLLAGAVAVADLDDTIGGEFQPNFWAQLQLLWVSPGEWETVLASIESKAP